MRLITYCYIIIFALVFGNPGMILADDPDELEIRRSGNYYWGEGVSEDRSEAISLARNELIGRIVTLVVAEQTYDITEDDEEYNTYYRSATRTISRMEIRGLDHRVTERRDGSYSALAWLHKEDYERTLDIERDRHVSKVRDIQRMSRSDGLNSVMREVYHAFLTTYYFPEPLYLPDGHGSETNARSLYRRKIDRWADEVRITSGTPEGGVMPGDVVEVRIPFQFEVEGRPVYTLKAGFDRAGYGTRRTIDGRTELYLERLPDRPVETHTLNFRPAVDQGGDDSREWRALASDIGPFYRRSVEIDFSPIIEVDFSARNIGSDAFRFNSRIENLSVSDIEWDFGDGTYSDEHNPAHQFDNPDYPVQITLSLNNRDDLTVVKELDSDGTLQPIREVGGDQEEMAETEPASRQTFSWSDLDLRSDKKDFLQDMSELSDAGELQRDLQTIGARTNIRFGNRDAVGSESESFVFIVDPDSHDIVGILSPEHEGIRTDIKTGERVINMEETYRGYGSVWLEP